MAVSEPVRRRYAECIFARTTRTSPPPNFRPLDEAPTGHATVEGCRGGGKNILELFLVAEDGRIRDLCASCGLCNPAMMVAADLVVDWARGQSLDAVLGLDVLDTEATQPVLEPLGVDADGDVPADALEKVRYALLALRRAVADHRGVDLPPDPLVPGPAGGGTIPRP